MGRWLVAPGPGTGRAGAPFEVLIAARADLAFSYSDNFHLRACSPVSVIDFRTGQSSSRLVTTTIPKPSSSQAPLASIIMPCYNARAYVEKSVQAILGQSLADFELIVVDDRSRDGSVEVLSSLAELDPRIKLIVHDQNRGASRSRNDGLRAARGEFIGFCDADDIWKPEKLATQVMLLRKNPTYDIAYCESEIIDSTGTLTGELFSDQFTLPKSASGDLFGELCLRNFVNMQTVLLRGSIGKDVYFDENIKWVEDWWQWIRLARRHRFLYDKKVLAQYRVHPHSTGFTQRPWIRRNRWKVIKRNLASHGPLPPVLEAQLWYQMGMELSSLGRRRLARKSFLRAAKLGLRGRCSLRSTIAIFARLSAEYLKHARTGAS